MNSLSLTPFFAEGRLLDRLPKAEEAIAAAFSIRRVATTYTGPAFRVRRALDGREQDIGFVQTTLDVKALENFCMGGDGYVVIWYDQSGRGRNATQTQWDLQPRIVDHGHIVRDKGQSENFSIEFNGAYLKTEWEPLESEVAPGISVLTVAGAGIGNQGQSGSVTATPRPTSVIPPMYPHASLPADYDKIKLETFSLPESGPSDVFAYHGANGNVCLFNVDSKTSLDTRVPTPGGVPTTTVDLISTGLTSAATAVQWNAGVLGANGLVYAVPFDAPDILEYNPATRVVRRFQWGQGGPGGLPTDVGKWWTGMLGSDGKIYCIPYNAERILVINTNTGVTATATVQDQYGGSAKWRDAVLDATSGKIFAMPYNSSSVLVITPGSASRTVGSYPGSEKWQSGVLMGSGSSRRIYGIPWNAGAVLAINPGPNPEETYLIGSTGMTLQVPGLTDGSENPVSYEKAGSGYRSNPIVKVADPPGYDETPRRGTLATGTATIQKTGIVTSITFTNGGTGYSSTPTLDFPFVNKGMVKPQASITMADDGTATGGRRIQSITVTNAGDGWTSAPAVSFSGGKGRTATAFVGKDRSNRVISITVSDGGTGYFSPPTVQIAGGGGSGATAEVSKMEYIDPLNKVLGMQIQEIRVTNPGSGYTGTPLVRFLGGKGNSPQGVAAQFALSGHVYGIAINSAGSGYSAEPSLSANPSYASKISIGLPEGGGGARAIARISSVDPSTGQITGITVWNSGSRYTGVPTVTVAPPDSIGGAQASATALWDTDGRIQTVTIQNQGQGYTQAPGVTLEGGDLAVGSGSHGEVIARLEDPSAPPNLLGTEKWSKATVNAQGGVFAVPYSTHRILNITPAEIVTFKTLSSGILDRLKKWSAAVRSADGRYAFGIPFNETRILRIDMEDNSNDSYFGNFGKGRWKAGVRAFNGSIYAVPEDSGTILVVDPRDPERSEAFPFGVTGMHSDIVLTAQGTMCGVPRNTNHVAHINPGATSLPPPAAVRSGNVLVFAPTPYSPQVTKIDLSNTSGSMPPQTTTVNVGPNPPSFAEAVMLRDGRTMVCIPFYNVNDTAQYTGNVGVFDSQTNAWSYAQGVSIPADHAPPPMSRSGVSLASSIDGGHAVAWVPRGTSASMIKYRNDTRQFSQVSQRGNVAVAPRTAAQVLPAGNTVVSTLFMDARASEKKQTNVGGWNKFWAGATASDGRVYALPSSGTSLEIYDATDAINYPKAVSLSSILDSGGVFNGPHSKFAGATFVPSRNELYGIPHASGRIIVATPSPSMTVNDVLPFGQSSMTSGDKWWGGVLTADEKIVCVPWDSSSIMLLDPSQRDPVQKIQTFGSFSGTAKWRHGVFANGKVYCIPHKAAQVLEIDPVAKTASTFGTSFPTDVLKWSDGVLAPNGLIYCVPWDSADVLVIDPVARTTRTFAHNKIQGRWAKGAMGIDEKIYCAPYGADGVLVIDPRAETVGMFEDFRIPGNDFDQNQKWGGLVQVPGGVLVGVPNGRSKYLEIAPPRNAVAIQTFGPEETFEMTTATTQRRFLNKPFIISKQSGINTQHFTVLHTDSGYGVFDAESKELTFGPMISSGATNYQSQILSSVSNAEVVTGTMFQGGVAGVRSYDGNADLSVSIVDNDMVFKVGNGSALGRNMFDVIFPPGELGVFSGAAGTDGTMRTYARDESIGIGSYSYKGNSVGEFFSVGRYSGNGAQSLFTGYLSECVIGSTAASTVDLARAQSLAYAT